VEMVTLTGTLGEMGILPQHVRMMTEMVPGELVVRKDGRDTFLAVGAGLVEVTGRRVSILTDMAGAAHSSAHAESEAGRPRGGGRGGGGGRGRWGRGRWRRATGGWAAPSPRCGSSVAIGGEEARVSGSGSDAVEWARAHGACFEVEPLVEVVRGRPTHVGFTI